MYWRQFVMKLEVLPIEAVEDVFRRHDVQAITYSAAGGDPVLEPARGETPLWTETRITGLFPASADLAKLQDDLLQAFHLEVLPEHRIEELEDRDWEREWLKDFRPMRFGRRLWVCPAGYSVNAVDAIIVHLDPGLAFGTGTHPTTALCLEWLDELDLREKRVLDFGCGSGILSIAALLLGARSVTAVDKDPQAVTASRRNAAKNGVEITTATDIDTVSGEFDIVVANVLAGPLVQHAGTICTRLACGGRVALSGITDDQCDYVREAYRHRIAFDPPGMRGRWVRLTGMRN